MRYFSYHDYGEDGVTTLSEEEIRESYYPYWYQLVCKKYGKEYTDATYSFEDCLDDWLVVNLAWESN